MNRKLKSIAMPDTPAPPTGYRAPAVGKAFALLRAVADAETPPGISQLSRILGMSKGSVHGLVAALLAENALEYDPGGRKILLGPALADLSLKRWNFFRIRRQVQPRLDELRDRIDETVCLGAVNRSCAVIVAAAEADKPIKISSPPGTVIPLMAGAVGKVFLARMAPGQAQEEIRRLGLTRFTPRSVTDAPAYLAQLAAVRKNGYALDDGEYLAGVKAVAVGLANRGALPMAVWAVGFSDGLDARKTDLIIAETKACAVRLKRLMDAEG